MVDRKNYSVIFFGTPSFAKAQLESIVDSGYVVKLVITNPDTQSGRGMKTNMSDVKKYAQEKNLDIYQPDKLRNNTEAINKIKEINPDFIVTAAYGKILPQEILDIPKIAAINVHGSLLPKYRGSAPVQWAIINGEKKTGITTMFMDSGMDTGDMLLKEEIEICDEDNLETVFEKLTLIGKELLIKTLDGMVDNSIVRIKQDESMVSYAPMISKEMTKIDFNKNYDEIFNFIRGLSPHPGCYMQDENLNKFKVFKIKKQDKSNALNCDKNIGKIAYMTKDKLGIVCKDSIVEILEIQAENCKRMDIVSFLAGRKISENTRFI